MSEWLVLCTEETDSWVKRVFEKVPMVAWLNKAPGPTDLESKELVVEAFLANDLKAEALRAISACENWRGPVASRISDGSATQWAIRSGLGGRLVGFQDSPNSEDPPAVELFRGETTESEVLREIQGRFEGAGFLVFLCRDQAGGILPRVLASMINEAASMAYGGIAPVDRIDRMMRLGANFPMGPLEWADRIGLDRVLALLEAMQKELGPQYQPCPWIRRKVEAGQLGVKTGEGFYNYASGGAL